MGNLTRWIVSEVIKMLKHVTKVRLSDSYTYYLVYRTRSHDYAVYKSNYLHYHGRVMTGDLFECADFILKEAKPCDFTI